MVKKEEHWRNCQPLRHTPTRGLLSRRANTGRTVGGYAIPIRFPSLDDCDTGTIRLDQLHILAAVKGHGHIGWNTKRRFCTWRGARRRCLARTYNVCVPCSGMLARKTECMTTSRKGATCSVNFAASTQVQAHNLLHDLYFVASRQMESRKSNACTHTSCEAHEMGRV